MSNNPVRLQSGDGIPITQTDNALDVNIASGLDSADLATQTTLAAVLAKIIAAPSTEAKQDLMQADITLMKADLAAILAILES
jgi:hypothetical protein